MLFSKPKPTVTLEDKDWVEEAFLWFEQQYVKDYLKCVRIAEPTREFFPIDFKGTRENANELIEIVKEYMDIRNVSIDLHFYSDKPLELAEGIVTAQAADGAGFSNNNSLGTYSEKGESNYSIGIELELLKDPIALIATIAHELSHLTLLGEGRIEENDEELTDLNTIALGFGIFTANNIFRFRQFIGGSHNGWQAQKSGYIPQEVATYGLALLTNYQARANEWSKFLDPSVKKMYERNLKYLRTTNDVIKFK